MEYMIYTFGGQAELIYNMFNGIARVFAADSNYFTVVGKFALTIGALWAGTRAIFHANIGIFGRQWFLPVFLAFTFLFAPKATVWIKDDLASTVYKIDNIPFAIAFFSSIPSTMSYAIAEKLEEKLKIADSIRNNKSGLMFGAKLVAKFRDLKIQDPVLLENTKQFCKQCYLKPWVMGNILGKKKEAEVAPNMLAFSQANIPQNFGIYYRDPRTRALEFKDCQEAITLITSQVEREVKNPSLFANLGAALGLKTDRSGALNARMLAISSDTLEILQKSTTNAHEWVKQSMMLNAYREALDDWREGYGHVRLWPELVSMNASRGLYQQSFGWLIAGEMASQALPLMQTVLFLLVVASIFLVFPFSMLPGGMEVLKLWIKLLIWVNSWPVFFAIINSMGMQILSMRSGTLGPDFGLDKLSQGQFSDLILHTYAMVQLFASMVPMLSWMVISKSGSAFVNLADKLLTTSVGGALGAAVADNTLSLDNINIGNRQLAQQHVGPSLNMASTFDTGVMRTTQATNGSMYLDERASQLATNYRGSSMEMQAIQNSYNESLSYMDSLNQRKAKLDSLEKSQMQDYASRWLGSHDVTDGANERIARDMRVVAGEGSNSQEGYSDRDSKGTDTHSSLNAEAHIGTGARGFNVKIPFTEIRVKGEVGASVKGETGTSARNTKDLSHDHSFQQSASYQESLDSVKGYAKTHDYRDSYGESNTFSSGLQSTWREQEQVAREQAQTAQKMQQYQEQQSYISQNQLSIDQNWNDEILETVQQRHQLSNKQDALSYLNEHGSEGRQVLAELIAAKYNMEIPAQITQKRLDLQAKTDYNLSDEKIDFNREKEKLHAQYNTEILPNHVATEVAEHSNLARKQDIEHQAQTLDKQIVNDNLKDKFQEQQDKFDTTDKSTLYRTTQQTADETGVSAAWQTGKKALEGFGELLHKEKEGTNE